MEFLAVEHALRKAVKEYRDFENSAGSIQSIAMKLKVTPAEREAFLKELVEFLNTYKSS